MRGREEERKGDRREGRIETKGKMRGTRKKRKRNSERETDKEIEIDRGKENVRDREKGRGKEGERGNAIICQILDPPPCSPSRYPESTSIKSTLTADFTIPF